MAYSNNSPAVGFKQTMRAISDKTAVKVLLAEDCEEKISIPVKEACGAAGIQIESVQTMRMLGKECGIDVKASCAAILRK